MKKITIYVITLLLCLESASVWADEQFNYTLGGGLPISSSTTNRAVIPKISGDLSWNSNLTCGNFNVATSIKSQLAGSTGAFQAVMSNVIQSATGVVGSLPALVIQKINPSLYDLLQNGILQAFEEYDLNMSACSSIVDDMGDTLETEGWGGLARAGFWKKAVVVPNKNIITANQQANSTGLDDGVAWVGGANKGGKNQNPILVNKDVSQGGYNILLNRSVGDNSPVSNVSCGGASLCEEWASPEAASKWITDVIGDKEIRTCQGCEKIKTKAGMGLHRKYEDYRTTLKTNLHDVVSGTQPINEATLKPFQGGEGTQITRQAIEAIREESDPGLMVERISSELAVMHTLEHAMFARRVLLAGMKEPNVANNKVAQENLNGSVEELNTEIGNLSSEVDIRSQMGSRTLASLYNRKRQRDAAPALEPSTKQTVKDGAVK